jgi:hypothetical protein
VLVPAAPNEQTALIIQPRRAPGMLVRVEASISTTDEHATYQQQDGNYEHNGLVLEY